MTFGKKSSSKMQARIKVPAVRWSLTPAQMRTPNIGLNIGFDRRQTTPPPPFDGYSLDFSKSKNSMYSQILV